MHNNLEKIKNLESSPKVIKKFLSLEEINQFLKLYEELPVTVNNSKQKVIKKRWLDGFGNKLELLFKSRLESIIGHFKMDNLITNDGKECFGLFQESSNPLKLHVDSGFNLNDLIYKQTLIPLSEFGETIIFKNRYYGLSTNFTKDEKELAENDPENYKKGKNIRSSEHLKLFESKPFNKNDHEKYLKHENIDNLNGLEIKFVYNWNLGDLLIFDRTSLHCSSSNIKNKKIGLTTFTKK
ncbi:hypothetical protein OAB59_00220 [Pelagibacteraceae bacterium]|nr:hypothetical protein [Pelagibacteraceae bacterium]